MTFESPKYRIITSRNLKVACITNHIMEETNNQKTLVEQPLISHKGKANAYSVERNYVNSKKFHDKFESIPVNKYVQERLYIEAGRLLEFVDGICEERLIAINARTGELIVDNFNRKGSMLSTGFTTDEAIKIDDCPDGIILLHNHSLNGKPSSQDLLTYALEDKVKISLIICHDGTVYGIFHVSKIYPEVYNEFINNSKQFSSDIDVVKAITTMRLNILNNKLGQKQKLFKVIEL